MGILRNAYYVLPPSFRRMARRFWYLPADTLDALLGRRGPMIPPRGRIFIGSGDFVKTGTEILNQLKELAGLRPGHRVLDVGCGIGRVAVPLTGYLDQHGSYEGFDIVEPAIRWCRERITSRHPGFRFTHIDLRNDLYNLGTRAKAKDFVFPYGNGEFDLVFLTSVFTHMLPDDVTNYLFQIGRVLKPGGRCFATFFLMNPEARELTENGTGFRFNNRRDHHYLFHSRVREANVAYEEEWLFSELIEPAGLGIEQVRYGYWPGRPKSTLNNFQDILILRKATEDVD
jgi:SAM-dependent methyltransferase